MTYLIEKCYKKNLKITKRNFRVVIYLIIDK